MSALHRFVVSTALAISTIGCATAPPASSSSPSSSSSSLGEAAQKWASAEQPASFVSFFKGTFTRLGITVVETGEQFTIVHAGDRFAFEPGVADVEVIVPVTQHNVDDLLNRAGDGALDDTDAYDIMTVLFTPLTREILKHPVSADNTLRQLAGVEERMHVILLSPDGKDGATHTLVYKTSSGTCCRAAGHRAAHVSHDADAGHRVPAPRLRGDAREQPVGVERVFDLVQRLARDLFDDGVRTRVADV